MARGIHRLTVLQVSKAARKGLTFATAAVCISRTGVRGSSATPETTATTGSASGRSSMVDLPAARERSRLPQAARRRHRPARAPARRKRAARRYRTPTASASMHASTAYFAAHGDGWRSPTHRQAWENSLRIHASPVIGKLPVAAIDAAAVLRVLEPIWKEKDGNRVTAARPDRAGLGLGWCEGLPRQQHPEPGAMEGHHRPPVGG